MDYKKFVLLFAGLASFGWGQVRVTVEVPANRAWTRTGVFIDPGSTVLIEATGLIEAVSPADPRPLFHRVPPEGRAEHQENKPQPTMRALVMLGRIGNGPVFEAGARTELTADPKQSGELQLGINDNNVADNTGSWSVQITVRGGAPITSQQRGTGRNQDPNDPGFRGSSSTSQERTDRYQDNREARGAGNPRYGDTDRRYRPDDQYRPNYRGSDYYRRYGHGFGIDEAVRICQQSVLTQASRRFRTSDIHFHRTVIDDSPGRDDWVTGTLDIHSGSREERFGFACSVNFDNGRVRSAEIDSRPLPDDPRWR